MSVEVRSHNACWTCRLRRKKCDESTFPCLACSSRQLTCEGYGPKPDWKDGGYQERRYASLISQQLRERRVIRSAKQKKPHGGDISNTASRSSPANLASETIQVDTAPAANSSLDLPLVQQIDQQARSSISVTSSPPREDAITNARNSDGEPLSLETLLQSDYDTLVTEVALQAQQSSSTSGTTPKNNTLPTENDIPRLCEQINGSLEHFRKGQKGVSDTLMVESPTEESLHLYMHYLTNIFPVTWQKYSSITPSYKCGGILHLLERSKAFSNISSSLSAYHISLTGSMTDDYDSIYRYMSTYESHRVSAVMHLRELMSISRASDDAFARKTEVLGTIMQLIIFEAIHGDQGHWQVYLESARIFLTETMDNFLTEDPQDLEFDDDETTLNEYTMLNSPRQNSIEVTIFEFFQATLISIDVLSSASAYRVPVFANCHLALLQSSNQTNLVGWDNEILLDIMDISALEAWKLETKAAKSLSLPELVKRGSRIESRIMTKVESLRNKLQCFLDHQGLTRSKDRELVNYILACSALVYVHIVMSGAQMNLPGIRQGVGYVTSAVRFYICPRTIPKLAWPLCVCACLATDEEKEVFIQLLNIEYSNLEDLGSVRHAYNIVEWSWQMRELDEFGDVSDWRYAMKTLGLRGLFV